MANSNIFYKTDEEVELIRASNLMVSKTLGLVGELLKPGVSGKVIDARAEEFIRDHGGIPSFKGYGGFPATLCVSKNEAVVHGIPNDEEFKDGDIVSVYLNGEWIIENHSLLKAGTDFNFSTSLLNAGANDLVVFALH